MDSPQLPGPTPFTHRELELSGETSLSLSTNLLLWGNSASPGWFFVFHTPPLDPLAPFTFTSKKPCRSLKLRSEGNEIHF